MSIYKFKKFFVLFLVSQLVLFSSAQSDFGGFETIGKKEGMFHVNTRTFFKDSKDFLWIGTSDGLMRYDGVIFDLFRKSKKDTVGLSDNTINCIVEDANKYVFWIGTALGGINRFDITKNKYSYFYIEPESNNERGMVQIKSMYQVSEDCFMVGTMYQGLYFFYPSIQKFIKLNDIYEENIFLPKEINQIIEGDQFIWVTAAEGLVQFDKKGNYLQIYFFTGKRFSTEPVDNAVKIVSLIDKKDNSIVFTAGATLFQYNLQTNEIQELLKLSGFSELNYLEMDHEGAYWIGSKNSGLFYFNKEQNVFKHFDANTGKENNILNNQIQDLFFCDNQSILWVATRNGISKYDYHKIKFTQSNINELTKGLVNNPYMISKDSKGGHWFWSQEGFFHKRNKEKYFSEMKMPENFVAYRMVEDGKANLWFATNQGLLHYNLNNGESELLHFSCDSCQSGRINFLTHLTPVVNDVVWISCKAGLIKFNVKTHKYDVFPIASGDVEYRFTALDYSKDKDFLWLASRRGQLWRFTIKTEAFERFEIIKSNHLERKPIVVLDIEPDDDGKIWLATYGAGLLLYDPLSKILSEELAVDMLESYVYGILSDHSGNFWMSSNFGISKVNVQSKEIHNYYKKDGTFCDEFNDKAHFKTKQGELLFGGTNGFISFHPDSLYINHTNSKLHVNAYTVENDVTLHGDDLYENVIYLCDSVIEVKRTQGAIKFYVSLLNFSHSNENKMKWKLEGYDDQWKEGYSYDVISYSNLKGGKYTLLVKGVNNDGVENKKVTSLTIKVKARLYETRVFKLLLIVLVIAVLFVLYKVRISWYQIKERNLTKKVDEKTKELVLINGELEASKEEMSMQKVELEVHRNYLEELVEIRTKDLEIAKLKAEESDRLKTAFLANLSHEIRTPMNAIIGFSSLLQTNEFPEDQKAEFLKVIGQSSESLLVLINDIIDISRIETGTIEIVKRNIQIPSLIKETLDELIFEEKGDNVRFMQFFELAPDDVVIFTDPFRLKQIISNLLRNAFKFTVDGYVKLTVKSVGKKEIIEQGFSLNGQQDASFHPILFMIEDTGIGIGNEDIKLIFEPFRKAENGSKFYKGMGLGLSIVHNLLGLFGGDVIVTSELEKGTTFSFYINLSSGE